MDTFSFIVAGIMVYIAVAVFIGGMVYQIKETGASSIVSPCENCRLQLDNLNQKYNLELEIKSLMDFVVDAMPLPENLKK